MVTTEWFDFIEFFSPAIRDKNSRLKMLNLYNLRVLKFRFKNFTYNFLNQQKNQVFDLSHKIARVKFQHRAWLLINGTLGTIALPG